MRLMVGFLGLFAIPAAITLITSAPALAESELDLMVTSSQIARSGENAYRVTTGLYKEGFFEVSKSPSMGVYPLVGGGTYDCGDNTSVSRTTFSVLGARDKDGTAVMLENLTTIPSGGLEFTIVMNFTYASPACREEWNKETSSTGSVTVPDNTGEIATAITNNERTLAGQQKAGDLVAPAVDVYRSTWTSRAITKTPLPAGCATVAGSPNCGKEAFELMVGKCWVNAANTVGAGIGVTNFADAVKSSTANCISLEAFGNTSKAAAIKMLLDPLDYASISSQVSTAMDAREATLTADIGDTESAPTCAVESIGWLVCPVITFLSNIAEGAMEQVSGFLDIPASSYFKQGGDAYKYWDIMRSYANIMFVIGFVAIIFSQVTSFGISNYGIKKLLPKLIAVALLVNISWYITVAAVDLSNFLGYALSGVLNAAIDSVPLSSDTIKVGQQTGIVNLGASALIFGVTAGATVAAAYFFLAAFLGVILSFIVTILTVFIVLAIREAAVIMLVVVSPLAFACMLLPNTESVFKKWLGILKALLVIFPIIGLLYGAAKVASTIIVQTATGNMFIQLIGSMLPFLVLITVVTLTKKALNAIDGLDGVANGIMNTGSKANNALLGGIRKRDQENRQILGNRIARSKIGRPFVRGSARRKSHIEAQKAEIDAIGKQGLLNDPKGRGQNWANRQQLAQTRAGTAQQQLTNNANANMRQNNRSELVASEAAKSEAKIEEATVEEMLVRDGTIQGLDDTLREATMRKDLAKTEQDTTWKERVQSDRGLSALDTATREAKLHGAVADKTIDARWEGEVATNTGLTAVANELRAQGDAESSAKRVQTTNYANALESNPSLLTTASGVAGTAGEQRIYAQARSVIAKEYDDSVKNLRTTYAMDTKAYNEEALSNIIASKTHSSEEKEAASAQYATMVGEDKIISQIDDSRTVKDASHRKAIQNGLLAGMKDSGKSLAYLPGPVRGAMDRGEYTTTEEVRDPTTGAVVIDPTTGAALMQPAKIKGTTIDNTHEGFIVFNAREGKTTGETFAAISKPEREKTISALAAHSTDLNAKAIATLQATINDVLDPSLKPGLKVEQRVVDDAYTLVDELKKKGVVLSLPTTPNTRQRS